MEDINEQIRIHKEKINELNKKKIGIKDENEKVEINKDILFQQKLIIELYEILNNIANKNNKSNLDNQNNKEINSVNNKKDNDLKKSKAKKK